MCLQVILYNTRGLHRKALELLSAHSGREDSPLQGTSRTVTYLQVWTVTNLLVYWKDHPSELGSSAHWVDSWVFSLGSSSKSWGGSCHLHWGHGHRWGFAKGTGKLRECCKVFEMIQISRFSISCFETPGHLWSPTWNTWFLYGERKATSSTTLCCSSKNCNKI